MGEPQNRKVCPCQVSLDSAREVINIEEKAVEAVRQFFYDWAVYDYDLAWAMTSLLDLLHVAYPELEAAAEAWEDLALRHQERMLRAKTLTLHFQPLGEIV